jgi:hypothetical protein
MLHYSWSIRCITKTDWVGATESIALMGEGDLDSDQQETKDMLTTLIDFV